MTRFISGTDSRILGIFLTHFHSDHIADLGEVMSRSWILGRDKPFTVYGGQEVEQVVSGFNTVYGADDASIDDPRQVDLFFRHPQPPGQKIFIWLTQTGHRNMILYFEPVEKAPYERSVHDDQINFR